MGQARPGYEAERYARLKQDPEWVEANRRRAAEWRAANRDQHRATSAAWQRDNQDAYRRNMREAQRRRRLGRDQLAGEYADVLRHDICSYCVSAPVEHIDHIEPVVLGGVNTWENLTGACASCNSRKRTRPMLIYLLEA